MTWLFWISLGLILYTYLGYPFLMYLGGKYFSKPWRQAQIEPTVSVILAVYNGAANIADKIDHLLSLEYPPELLELLVVSDGSTDATNQILRDMTRSRLTKIILDKNAGKAVALNAAIKHATGQIILFVDIRPRLEQSSLRMLLRNFEDESVGAAAGELFLHDENQEPGARAVGGLYWRYEQWIRKCEGTVDSPVGVYGGFYAVRRHLVTEFPTGIILDDMFQPLSVVRQGYRSILDVDARVWDSWPKTVRGEFRRKVRTLAGNYQLLLLAPWLLTSENRLRFQLVSHKLLRLLTPFALVLLLFASVSLRTSTFIGSLAVAQLVFYCVATLGAVGSFSKLKRLTAPATAFCMLNLAALCGLYWFLRRRDQLTALWVRSEANTPRHGVKSAVETPSGTG